MKTVLAAVGAVIGLGAFAALVGSQRAKAAPAPAVTPENLINQILFALRKKKMGDMPAFRRVKATAAQTAEILGLKRTAKALRAGEPLPDDETWPGTNQSVRAYVAEKRKEAAV